jgi:hypothetical protein
MLLGAACLLAGGPAPAQQPAYKCGSSAHPTYSDRPCPGGRQVGPAKSRVTDTSKTPPQDRAVIARRARLTADERKECSALDRRLAQEKARLKTKGDAVTLEDEMPLVRVQKQFRELRC